MNTINKFPIIETEDLILRELNHDDLDGYFEIFGSEQVLKYYGLKPKGSPEELVKRLERNIALFSKKKGMRFAICDKSGKLIGTIGFKYWDKRNLKAEISYELVPQHWNKGYMPQAVKAIVKFGFEHHLNRIEAWVMSENVGSSKVLKKCGFKSEGVHRQSMSWDGKLHDIEWYSILRSDLN
jgi:ribosomal-protein-alanine N-acetyltransferase